MTRPEVTWGEPQNMPTDIELEPVTGKALQEFGRYQSVVYNLPKMISVLVEPWYALVGEREQVLALMRSIWTRTVCGGSTLRSGGAITVGVRL